MFQVGDRFSTPLDGTWELLATLRAFSADSLVLLELIQPDQRSGLYHKVGELHARRQKELLYGLGNGYYTHIPREWV